MTTPDAVSGTLTKTSAWTDAEKLTIIREVELTQEIDLINGEKIDGEELEKGLDLKAAGLQQMQELSAVRVQLGQRENAARQNAVVHPIQMPVGKKMSM